MPMPWKKSKVGRISRLVADFQQSPKHGGSLVVETGFPTSLIDLFVKNRDRLKKSSKRHRFQPSPPCPPPLQTSRSLPVPLKQRKVEKIISPARDEVVVGDGDAIDAGSDHCPRSCDGARVFFTVLKVFVVVVLALSTKKLALGITLSAFVLLFIEFVAARALDAPPIFLDLLINRVSGKRDEEKIETQDDQYFEIAECREDPKSPQEKIRIQAVVSYREPLSVVIPDKNRDRLDTEIIPRAPEGNQSDCKLGKTKSSKLKSKIVKKIVPKKFRKKKSKKIEDVKDQSESATASEVSSIISDEKSDNKIEEEEEEESQSPAVEFRIEEEKEEEISRLGIDGSEKRFKIESNGNKGLIILVLIALCGLLYGKVSAIALTLFWCLMPRIYRKICKV